MSVLLIDNFDSFTYNLYQYLGELTDKVMVVRNDQILFDELRADRFSHIVISPGPGDPTNPDYFGGCKQVIEEFHTSIPMLGVCLGHQGIAAYFGASIIQAPKIMHGKTSELSHSGQGILAGLPDTIAVMRYHSLVADPATIPQELIADSVADDGSIMAFHHRQYPTFGVQFHPESFRTETGKAMLTNFLQEQKHG